MNWFVLTLTMIFKVVPHWWNEGGFQFCVMFGSGANVVLGLLSRARLRRSPSSGWAKGEIAMVSILWLLYQVADAATGNAISNLTLCDTPVSDDEKVVVAFWAPFLLLHLGGPDNLTAYALEDNKLSGRKIFEMVWNIIGVGYAVYKYTIRGGGHGGGLLLAASMVMFAAGFTRYTERVYALWKANLDQMQEDSSPSWKKSNDDDDKTPSKQSSSCSRCSAEKARMDELKSRIEGEKGRREICDEDALLFAQDMCPIWSHALIDSSVMPRSSRQLASEAVLSLKWRSMCKVAEMELSLVYELLHTKAVVAREWLGWYYLIRFVSPLCIVAAALLFSLHREQQQQQEVVRGSYVAITYALLVVNLLLDLAWLLRALGSTWAYAYLQAPAAWLHHQVICPCRWRRLHRFVIRIDPMRWLLRRDPVSNRTWSGTIGQYNLLEECATARSRSSQWPEVIEWLVSKLMPEDRAKELPYLYTLHTGVKKLLFKRVRKILQEAIAYEGQADYSKKHYIMEDIRTKWGEKAYDLRNWDQEVQKPKTKKLLFEGLKIHEPKAPKFGKEFEEDVLTWHIATCIILPYTRQKGVPGESEGHAKAIAVVSDYMMFLVAVRRRMLPGLVLHSLFEVTKQTLFDIWNKVDRTRVLSDNEMKKVAEASNGEKLAMILRHLRRGDEESLRQLSEHKLKPNDGSRILWDSVQLFCSLTLAGEKPGDRATPGRKRKVPVARLLEFIFNVWVDKLVYAAVRCSRESHAKQLSAGGDLTTVLWMVIQHAGPFRMGEQHHIYIESHGTQVTRDDQPPTTQPQPPPQHPAPVAGRPPRWSPVVGASPGGPTWSGLPTSGDLPGWFPWYPYPPQGVEPAGDEHGITPTAQTSPPPDEDSEDEDKDQKSDDEDETKEYNTPVTYFTLH
jgi:hypothetical protein